MFGLFDSEGSIACLRQLLLNHLPDIGIMVDHGNESRRRYIVALSLFTVAVVVYCRCCRDAVRCNGHTEWRMIKAGSSCGSQAGSNATTI